MMLAQPSQGSANPSASFPALWNYLEPALDHILRSSHNGPKAPAIAVDYHMMAHTHLYNYFTAQSDASVNGPGSPSHATTQTTKPEKDRFIASGCDLYEQLDRYFAEAAREILANAPHEDGGLFTYYAPSYERYKAGVLSVARLLNYVNRHYVKRAVDEDRGWMRLGDVVDVVANAAAALRESAASVNGAEISLRAKIAEQFRARRNEELRKWGYIDGGPADAAAKAEARAEAASSPDRIVPVSSLGMRRWRTEVLEPLLATNAALKGKGKRRGGGPGKGGSSSADSNPIPKSRLARAVRDWTGDTGPTGLPDDERLRIARVVAESMADTGVKFDHPLRKKLAKFTGPAPNANGTG
ncbi:hypothetical protein BKA62DRAFT_497118 [Auriculariales sp. MPI-PUGE-AT-0066]|nr:hypothetical protein BKA62DRAFT_497118 [Auriculariales sp. MPI-PUGE-AT-0066]